MEQKDVLETLRRLGATEEKVAVATVVRTYGSTPRHASAKMVILANGTFFGTVGGGCGEAEVWQEAQHVLDSGEPCTVRIDLTENPDEGGEKICGGRMDVFVERLTRDDLASLNEVLARMDRGHGMALGTVINGTDAVRAGQRLFVDSHGWASGSLGDDVLDARVRTEAPAFIEARRSQVIEAQDGGLVTVPRSPSPDVPHIFLEVIEPPPLLVIAGAGHCALPLARMGRLLGFEIVILDDRPECATAERFPDAARILVGDLGAEIERVPLDAHTHVVLVTRGHKQDEAILRRIVHHPLGYIGMIGSRRRIRAVFADMERDGFDPVHLNRVYAPIGLDIGAETPEEIAVCILGEIIRVRKGGSGQSLSLRSGRQESRGASNTSAPERASTRSRG